MTIMRSLTIVLLIAAASVLLFPIVWFGAITSRYVAMEFALAVVLLSTTLAVRRSAFASVREVYTAYAAVVVAALLEAARLTFSNGPDWPVGMPDVVIITAIVCAVIKIHLTARTPMRPGPR